MSSGFGSAWREVAAQRQPSSAARSYLSQSPTDIYDPQVLTQEKIEYMLELRASGNDIIAPYADKFPGSTFFWRTGSLGTEVDVALYILGTGLLARILKELGQASTFLLKWLRFRFVGFTWGLSDYVRRGTGFAYGWVYYVSSCRFITLRQIIFTLTWLGAQAYRLCSVPPKINHN